MRNHDFTAGGIAGPPVRFDLLVLAALFLQEMFFFFHYFFLENTVQRWYKIADDI